MCYVTLRGLVYFGASIHVYHGAQMLINMYYDLFATSASREANVTQVDVIFNCCFITLGILIFRGVEQKSKTFIKWPTIGFTLLLAFRFIIEIVKQVEREREGISTPIGGPGPLTPGGGKVLSPFSYSSMSIDVDPLISAAVGIYIFILFVYNHSLEYAHSSVGGGQAGQSGLPFAHQHQRHSSSVGSDCGALSDASSDTVLLLNTQNHIHHSSAPIPIHPGDSNNNQGNGRIVPHPITTIANPLFELDSRGQRNLPLHLPLNLNGGPPPGIYPQTPSPTDYKVDAV